MPLHDWSDRPGWAGMHHLWIAELLRWIKPRLPDGFREYIDSAPLLGVGAALERPDLGVRSWSPTVPGTALIEPVADAAEPDEEVAVATLDPESAVFVERDGRLIAAVEVISPRNKDRPAARDAYLARYVGYLLNGAHLVVIDVHRRPSSFSSADRIAEALQMAQPALPAPMAVSYRVGEPAATGGRLLAIWRRPLRVGEPLPVLPLPLSGERSVEIDLDRTYLQAAADVYLG